MVDVLGAIFGGAWAVLRGALRGEAGIRFVIHGTRTGEEKKAKPGEAPFQVNERYAGLPRPACEQPLPDGPFAGGRFQGTCNSRLLLTPRE